MPCCWAICMLIFFTWQVHGTWFYTHGSKWYINIFAIDMISSLTCILQSLKARPLFHFIIARLCITQSRLQTSSRHESSHPRECFHKEVFADGFLWKNQWGKGDAHIVLNNVRQAKFLHMESIKENGKWTGSKPIFFAWFESGFPTILLSHAIPIVPIGAFSLLSSNCKRRTCQNMSKPMANGQCPSPKYIKMISEKTPKQIWGSIFCMVCNITFL